MSSAWREIWPRTYLSRAWPDCGLTAILPWAERDLRYDRYFTLSWPWLHWSDRYLIVSLLWVERDWTTRVDQDEVLRRLSELARLHYGLSHTVHWDGHAPVSCGYLHRVLLSMDWPKRNCWAVCSESLCRTRRDRQTDDLPKRVFHTL